MVLSKKIFNDFSTDGEMSLEEFKAALDKLGYTDEDEDGFIPVSRSDIEPAFVRLDVDGNGVIDYEEFFKWWSSDVCKNRADPDDDAVQSGGYWSPNAKVSYQRAMQLRGTEEERTELDHAKAVFERVSSQKKTMDKDHFQKLCYLNGYCLTEVELDHAFWELDKDESGSVDFPEFYRWWRKDERFKHLSSPYSDDKEWITQVCEHFKLYDERMVGYLTVQQFKDMYDHGLYELVPFSMEDCLAQIDQNGDGRISLNEFILWYNSEYDEAEYDENA